MANSNSTDRHRFSIMTALAALLLLQSCLPNYFARRPLKEEISKGQVVGRWRLTKESAAMLDLHGLTVNSRDSTVEFFGEGRCVLQNFVYGDDLITQPGTWTIEHDVAEGGGSFKKNELRIAIISSGKPRICFLDFGRERNRFLLWRYHGDPDGRNYVDYERE